MSAPRSPWVQAIDLSFAVLFAAVAVLAMVWLCSGVREIGPGTQALVLRFGAVVASHGPGLLVTWPAPVSRVEIVPGPDRLVELPLSRFAGDGEADLAAVLDPHRNAAFVLTGDTGLVRLRATLFYSVVSAPDYWLARDRLEPALDRLAAATIAEVAAGRDLDGVMVARPEATASIAAAARREQLRGTIVAGINHRLDALAAEGAGLGVRAARIDVVAALPQVLRPVYDGVLSAVQEAEQAVAEARTEAAGIDQAAQRLRIQLLRQAQAGAEELVAGAQGHTAELRALVAHAGELSRASMLDRVYRERIGAILEQAGSVTTLAPGLAPRLILSGSVSP